MDKRKNKESNKNYCIVQIKFLQIQMFLKLRYITSNYNLHTDVRYENRIYTPNQVVIDFYHLVPSYLNVFDN